MRVTVFGRVTPITALPAKALSPMTVTVFGDRDFTAAAVIFDQHAIFNNKTLIPREKRGSFPFITGHFRKSHPRIKSIKTDLRAFGKSRLFQL